MVPPRPGHWMEWSDIQAKEKQERRKEIEEKVGREIINTGMEIN